MEARQRLDSGADHPRNQWPSHGFAVASARCAIPFQVSFDCRLIVAAGVALSLNEAIFVLQEGIATAEELDTGMKLGCNHPIGPLALADLVGLDTLLAVLKVFYEDFNDPKYRPAPMLKEMVAAGWLGRKSGRGFYRY
jgi:3-hydroxybutyryl-CoA dehydrogenase